MTMTINFIGCGKLGKTIAKCLSDQNDIRIAGVCNQTLNSAETAIAFINQGQAFASIHELPPADITFITSPDDKIQACANQLASSPQLKLGSSIVHCSGLLPSTIMQACQQQGCYIYSAHPMRSFSNPTISTAKYTGTYCAIEGCEPQIAVIDQLFQSIGSITYRINPQHKASYHAASVMASNYLITLAENAHTSFESSGIAHEQALDLVISLMTSTLHNLEATRCFKSALTGPIQRGDINTVKLHLENLPSEKLTTLYKQLGEATLKIATHSRAKQQALANLLNNSVMQ